MARDTGSLMPPMHILNAPTRLMRDLGYGSGDVYDHATEEGFSGQNYFPDGVARRNFYRPGERGFEREIKKRLEYWDKLRQRASTAPSPPRGRRGQGEVGDARAPAVTHLTLPRRRRGPLPLPPEGRRGYDQADETITVDSTTARSASTAGSNGIIPVSGTGTSKGCYAPGGSASMASGRGPAIG